MADDQFRSQDDSKTNDAVTPEQIKEYKEKAEKAEQLEKELEKYKAKEYNLSNLRYKSKKEREELINSSGKERKFLLQEMSNVYDELESTKNMIIEPVKGRILAEVAGDDSKFKEEVELEYSRLGNNARTKEEIANQYEEAALLVQRRRERINKPNPLNAYVPSSGAGDSYIPNTSKKNYAETKEGEDLARSLGMSFINQKKQ